MVTRTLGASMHGAGPEGHFVRERWALAALGICHPDFHSADRLADRWLGLLLILFYPVQVVRITVRTLRRGIALPSAFAYGIFCVLAKFPEFAGFCKFQRDRLSSRPRKSSSTRNQFRTQRSNQAQTSRRYPSS